MCGMEGPDKLLNIMYERGISQEQIRGMLGISCGTLSRWLSGDREMKLRYALAIEQLFGIHPSAWVRDPVLPLKAGKAAE